MKITYVPVLMDTGALRASLIVPADLKRHVITMAFAIKPRDRVHVILTGAETKTVPHVRQVGTDLIAR